MGSHDVTIEQMLRPTEVNLGLTNVGESSIVYTLPETNKSPMKIPIFPGKYHEHGEFSMTMLVLGGVVKLYMSNLVPKGLGKT